jgi:hypothetical protein
VFVPARRFQPRGEPRIDEAPEFVQFLALSMRNGSRSHVDAFERHAQVGLDHLRTLFGR